MDELPGRVAVKLVRIHEHGIWKLTIRLQGPFSRLAAASRAVCAPRQLPAGRHRHPQTPAVLPLHDPATPLYTKPPPPGRRVPPQATQALASSGVGGPGDPLGRPTRSRRPIRWPRRLPFVHSPRLYANLHRPDDPEILTRAPAIWVPAEKEWVGGLASKAESPAQYEGIVPSYFPLLSPPPYNIMSPDLLMLLS